MVHFSTRKGDKILCFFSGEQEVDVELQTCVTGEGVEKIMHLPPLRMFRAHILLLLTWKMWKNRACSAG